MAAPRLLSRTEFLRGSGLGLGTVALNWLMAARAGAARSTSPGSHFEPRARAIIQLVQNGGPSQMDLFDPKPELQRRGGEPMPGSVETFQGGNTTKLLKSPFSFRRCGRSGVELSEALPGLAAIADEITLVRSMYSEHANHIEALVLLSTGKIFQGRPTLGAWVTYALGTQNENLPAYVVLRDPAGYNTCGRMLWQTGWMPAAYQGIEFSTQGPPVHDLKPEQPRPAGSQDSLLRYLGKLNRHHQAQHPSETELDARIRNFELAARMQLSATQVMDLSQESGETRKLYGLDHPVTRGYGSRLLAARRLVEAGVRFVQVFPPPYQPWDSHSNVRTELEKICAVTDRPVEGFIRDLRGRGLLDETIVLWAGEFGRLPVSQGSLGRDHNRNAFSLWLAGGGFRRGLVHGETDEFGYRAVTDRVSVQDLQATLLHQMGLNHRLLTYPHLGRQEALTDPPVTGARVVAGLIDGDPHCS